MILKQIRYSWDSWKEGQKGTGNFDTKGEIYHQSPHQDKKSCGSSRGKSTYICQAKQTVTRPQESMGLPAAICYGGWPTSVKPHKYRQCQAQRVYSNHFPSPLSKRNRGRLASKAPWSWYLSAWELLPSSQINCWDC